MPDREKVIKEAEEAFEFLAPDDKHRLHMGIMMKLGWIYDAIALLKEKEEKAVEICGRLSMLKYGNCPRCGKYMNSEVYPHWCGFCGQAVKWE